jgi:hypothetical protein
MALNRNKSPGINFHTSPIRQLLIEVLSGWTPASKSQRHLISPAPMPRSLIQVYALTVCFCTLMCAVIALGLATYDLIRIAAPGFTIVNNYGAWDSHEQFVLVYPDKKGLPTAELTILREKHWQEALAYERKTGQQGFLFAFIILAIDGAVYAIHWRIARRGEPVRN